MWKDKQKDSSCNKNKIKKEKREHKKYFPWPWKQIPTTADGYILHLCSSRQQFALQKAQRQHKFITNCQHACSQSRAAVNTVQRNWQQHVDQLSHWQHKIWSHQGLEQTCDQSQRQQKVFSWINSRAKQSCFSKFTPQTQSVFEVCQLHQMPNCYVLQTNQASNLLIIRTITLAFQSVK